MKTFFKIFYCLDLIISSNGNCSQEIKRGLILGQGAMEELGKISKSKNVSLETSSKVIHILVFSITMYWCKSWTVKKAYREKK